LKQEQRYRGLAIWNARPTVPQHSEWPERKREVIVMVFDDYLGMGNIRR